MFPQLQKNGLTENFTLNLSEIIVFFLEVFLLRKGTKIHKWTELNEDTKLHEDVFAQKDKIAQR